MANGQVRNIICLLMYHWAA